MTTTARRPPARAATNLAGPVLVPVPVRGLVLRPALVLGLVLGLALVLALGLLGALAASASSLGLGGSAPAEPPPAGADAPWERPVPGPVAHPFDPPARRWLAGHRGADLAATAGGQVRAPAAGVVSFAGKVAGKPVVVVTHPGGLRSTFEPVTADVRVGARVGPGAVLGVLAPTPGHCAPASCLHWGVRRGEVYLDPLAFLGEQAPIVLLPGGP
ncbi:murein hydrolase activator EnvC family protein [Isoptericola sp. NPDC055881]